MRRAIAVLFACGACSGEISSIEPEVDAATADSGTGFVDAGDAWDAGSTVDAGAPDAGPADAGSVVDAGPADAGAVVDAGPVDAGPPPTYVAGNPCQSGNGVIYFTDAGSVGCTLMDQSLSRIYRLVVPAGYRANGSLVVMLHGHPSTAAAQETYTQLTPFAHAKGFAAVYPEGTFSGSGITWSIYDVAGRPDDVLFLRNLVTKLTADLRLDPKRIYFAGFSGGGIMAHLMGRDASDLIAAIGSACGAVAIMPDAGVQLPSEPVSVISYAADADTTASYCLSASVFAGMAHTDYEFDYWSSGNGCTTATPAGPLCTAPDGTPTALTTKAATACGNGAEVVFYRLRGQGHTYQPTLTTAMNPAFNATTGLTTNDLFWNFFQAHPKR